MGRVISCDIGYILTGILCNSNNFVVSVALVAVCALLSAILVKASLVIEVNTRWKYKLLCPRGTQTCALAVANIAHAVYLLDVAKRPIPQG